MSNYAMLGLFLVVVFCCARVEGGCNWPPSVWCSSIEIARECQVEKACFSNVWDKSNQDAAPVKIGLYYESLCPGCRDFIQKELYPAFRAVSDIANITLVPFGNAKEKWNETTHRWDFTCQHGRRECVGNVIETCAINLYPDPATHISFILCIETARDFPDVVYKDCAAKSKIDASKIQDCFTSKDGNTYEHNMALKTPTHKYVPWVTLNGVHTEEIEKEAFADLVKLICSTYKGTKPAGCSEGKRFKDWL